MKMHILNEIWKECFIDFEWFYHSTRYEKTKYISILTEGIKCNYLLNNLWSGTYNGMHYISLSKITNPDNDCFLYYSMNRPSFILHGIDPILCYEDDLERENIHTSYTRAGLAFEYQYFYFISHTHILGIVYNLYDFLMERIDKYDKRKLYELLEILCIFEKYDINIPIYDYSRRNGVCAHEIEKEKIKYYAKKGQLF